MRIKDARPVDEVRSLSTRTWWLFGLASGAANLVGLVAARSSFLGVILQCDRLYPDGCETHMLIWPFMRASWIGVGTGALAAFAATLVGIALGWSDMSLARVLRIAGALFVYVGSISMLVLFTGIPYWYYVLFAIFIVGPPLAVMTALRDPAEAAEFSGEIG